MKVSMWAGGFSREWYMDKAPSVEEQIKMVADLKFDGIELTSAHVNPLSCSRAERKKIRGLIESKGLEKPMYTPSTNFYNPSEDERRKEIKYYGECIKLAVDLDIGIVRWEGGMPWPGGGREWMGVTSVARYADCYQWAKDSLNQCAKMAEDAGVVLAVDNHFFAPISENARMIEELGSPKCLRMNVDCGNAEVMKDDYIGAVRKWGKLIVHTHNKDLKRLSPITRNIDTYSDIGPNIWHYQVIERLMWVPIGEGEVDIKGFVKALKDVGYNGSLSIEDFSTASLRREYLRKGVECLRKLI